MEISGQQEVQKNEETGIEREVPKGFHIWSRWKIFSIVFVAAVLTVVYVNNVLRIDALLEQTQSLKKNCDLLKNNNELLRARLNQLQSADRIIPIARDELGMIKADKAPEMLP